MKLADTVEINAPVEDVWDALLDIERIAPCLPGTKLEKTVGDEFHGVVKIKVGPITAQYRGIGRFLEIDPDRHQVKLKADGRDTRGAGNASAIITATLVPTSASVTTASVETDLTITGKVAQFGRGAISDVSGALMTQFASNLEALFDEPSSNDETTDPRAVGHADEHEAIDLLSTAGQSSYLRTRGIAVAAALVSVVLVVFRLTRRRSGSASR